MMICVLITASVAIFCSYVSAFAVYIFQINEQLKQEIKNRELTGKLWDTEYNNGWDAAVEHYKVR